MKPFTKVAPAVATLAALILSAVACDTPTDPGPSPSPSAGTTNVSGMPYTMENGDAVGGITDSPSGSNTVPTSSFSATIVNTALGTDANMHVVTFSTDPAATGSDNDASMGGAVNGGDPATVLGTKVLKFTIASSSSGGHVVLHFPNVDFGNLTGKTGIQFDIRFPDMQASGAIQFIPHIRYNNGSNENASTFIKDIWNWVVASHEWYTFKIPFSGFSKPGYGSQSETSIAAALTAGTVFNQLDFDMVFQNTGTADGTAYTGYIDNIKVY